MRHRHLICVLAACAIASSAIAQDPSSANFRFELIDTVVSGGAAASTSAIAALAVLPVTESASSPGFHAEIGQLGGYGIATPTGPQVIAVTPPGGSCAGGELVRILGFNFNEFGTGATTLVRIGTAPPFHPTVVSNTEMIALTPPGPPGGCDLQVTTLFGAKTAVSAYQYACPSGPPVTAFSITPGEGDIDGGLTVTISGLSLITGTTVTFSGVPATDVTRINDQTLTCRTPPHAAGFATPVISNSLGVASLPNAFFYKTHAAVTNLGGGCPGSFGTPQCFVGGALPIIGGAPFSAVLANAKHNASAALLISAPLSAPFVVSPCQAWIDPLTFISFPVTTSAFGTSNLVFQVPNVPALEGFLVASQWLVFDENSALGLVLSNAQRLRLGF